MGSDRGDGTAVYVCAHACKVCRSDFHEYLKGDIDSISEFEVEIGKKIFETAVGNLPRANSFASGHGQCGALVRPMKTGRLSIHAVPQGIS